MHTMSLKQKQKIIYNHLFGVKVTLDLDWVDDILLVLVFMFNLPEALWLWYSDLWDCPCLIKHLHERVRSKSLPN